MVPQATTAEKQKKIAERIEKVITVKHRTDGGHKFKTKPKEVEEGLKKAKTEADKKKLPRKVVKKRRRQEDKAKPIPPPFCRYIEGIECFYANARWPGIAEELKSRDKMKRPKAESGFCKETCLPHVMGKHQVTNFFSMGVGLSKQLAQVIGALNIIAQGKIPKAVPPKVTERKHPQAPPTSLRTLATEPDKITKKTD